MATQTPKKNVPSQSVAVNAAAETPADEDLETLVADYEENYGNAAKRKKCRVCESPHRALVDALLDRAASPGSIQTFLHDRRAFDVGASQLERHKKLHHSVNRDG